MGKPLDVRGWADVLVIIEVANLSEPSKQTKKEYKTDILGTHHLEVARGLEDMTVFAFIARAESSSSPGSTITGSPT